LLPRGAIWFNVANYCTNANRFSFARDDSKNARAGGRDFTRRLVGLQLKERLGVADGVAVLLEPACQHAFGDRFTDGWHFDVQSHVESLNQLLAFGPFLLRCLATN